MQHITKYYFMEMPHAKARLSFINHDCPGHFPEKSQTLVLLPTSTCDRTVSNILHKAGSQLWALVHRTKVSTVLRVRILPKLNWVVSTRNACEKMITPILTPVDTYNFSVSPKSAPTGLKFFVLLAIII